MAEVVKPVYTLAGTELTSVGVWVQSAAGLFSLPKMKTRQTVDWPDKNGVIVDLEEPRYQPRSITLNCLSRGKTSGEAMAAVIGLMNRISTKGLKTLTVSLGGTAYSYEVYCKEGIEVSRKSAGGGKVVVEFTVKLEEPHPVNFIPNDKE